MIQTTIIPYAASPVSGLEPFLTLEQEILPAALQSANLADITAMWYMAISGLSAATYIADRCPVIISNGVVTVMLGLYIFPSSLDLGYSLTLSGLATLKNGPNIEIVPLQREFDLVIPQSDTVSLDFVPESDFSYEWETDAYDALGSEIPRPSLVSIEREKLTFSGPCFGVLRCKCTIYAHYYPISISLTKAAQPSAGSTQPNRTGYKITNLQTKVLASWSGLTEQKNASLQLKIPDCVKSLLEICPDGATSKNTDLNLNATGNRPVVYYSSCDGSVLGVRYE